MTTIFISIPWFHPAYKAGGPVQSVANLVNNFTEEVTYKIFCGNTDLDNMPLAHIETGKWVKYNEHTEVWYAGTYNRSETLLAQVKKTKPDILYIIGIYSWYFNIVPLIFCKDVKKIVSARGMLHPGALSEKAFKKKVFLSAWKLSGLQKKTSFHASDDTEKKYIQDVFGEEAEVYTAANFPRKIAAQKNIFKQSGSLHLISIALISPMKNHLLVLQALEECTAAIDYHIYGPVKDNAYWQLCTIQVEKLPANIRTIYHGNVEPQQVEALLQQAHVFILPSKSENFGHAIFEALSAGKPVITSNHTPWQQLEINKAGLNADTNIDAIKNAIAFFAAMSNTAYNEWVDGAENYANNALDTEKIKVQYREMFLKPLNL